VSECVDSCTPFVYGESRQLNAFCFSSLLNNSVSRPLFIEEHGLRLLLSRSGVGVELSRAAYEAGEWARAIEDAWIMGLRKKSALNGIGLAQESRKEEGRTLARQVVEWVKDWQSQDGPMNIVNGIDCMN
jgi:hypothetical protein